ncbi:hypothetical protein RY280_23415 [Bacillus paralicheniformis]|uniref:hypothetical protein n=1 Tax=Bacillus paralicheniformis TaxID=1648923 RepID=UPI00203F7923|nr:hypothetical protein [Bacillus paralicheniformis]MCM3425535.1 hypothetical protein [Bacillus paralicheniformis]
MDTKEIGQVASIAHEYENHEIEIGIKFFKGIKSEDAKKALLSIGEVLKAENISIERFERHFGVDEKTDANTAREIMKQAQKRIEESLKVENTDGYREVVEHIKRRARDGFDYAAHKFLSGDLSYYEDISRALEEKGFRCLIRDVRTYKEIVISWAETEETE